MSLSENRRNNPVKGVWVESVELGEKGPGIRKCIRLGREISVLTLTRLKRDVYIYRYCGSHYHIKLFTPSLVHQISFKFVLWNIGVLQNIVRFG